MRWIIIQAKIIAWDQFKCFAPDRRRGHQVLSAGPLVRAEKHGAVTWNIPGMNIGYGELKTIEMYEFIKAVTEGYQPSTSFQVGCRVEKVCDAVMKSADTRQWVKVED